jgi:predicted RNase H-like nuclease (RuvC/YqgF family)
MQSEPYDKVRSKAADARREERENAKLANDPNQLANAVALLTRLMTEMKQDVEQLKSDLRPVLQANGNNFQIAWPKIEYNDQGATDAVEVIVTGNLNGVPASGVALYKTAPST